MCSLFTRSKALEGPTGAQLRQSTEGHSLSGPPPTSPRQPLQCGWKAPLGCTSEMWLRSGLCSRGGDSHPRLAPKHSSATRLRLWQPVVSDCGLEPWSVEGPVPGVAHNWRPAALCSDCVVGGVSQTPLTLKAEPHLHASLKIQGPGFPLQRHRQE